MNADDAEILAKAKRLAFLVGFLLIFGAQQDFEPFGVGGNELARLRAIGLLTETDNLSVTYNSANQGLNTGIPRRKLGRPPPRPDLVHVSWIPHHTGGGRSSC